MSASLLDEIRKGAEPLSMPMTFDQYMQLVESGILTDGDPIELIDGFLVRKDRGGCGEAAMTHHPRHALLIKRLQRLLAAACDSDDWHVQSQLPVILSPTSVPEPDVAVVRGTEDDYADHHPGTTDVSLVIEVADSSLGADRSTKLRLYASAGIPNYWIINLPGTQIESYQEAASGTYVQQTITSPARHSRGLFRRAGHGNSCDGSFSLMRSALHQIA